MQTLRILILWLGVIALAAAGYAEDFTRRLEPAAAESLAAAVRDPLLKSDYYSRAWMNEKSLQVVEASGVRSSNVLWRMARAKIDLGEKKTGKAALALYEAALADAQSAVDIDPSNALAQQALAVACGRVALFKGVFKSLGLVKRVHEAGLRAAAKGDSLPIALYVLGRTHAKLIEKPAVARKMLGLGWVSEDSVSYYYNRALRVSRGNMIQCRVEFAEFLINVRKDVNAARKMLQETLALPIRDEQDPPARARAEELLRNLK